MKHSLHNEKYVRERKAKAKDAEKRTELEKRSKYSDAVISDEFKKLKKKFLTGAIIKSAVCGVSAGLFAAGVLLLTAKLGGIKIDLIWYIIAGVACALVCGGITFLFLKPSNKKVAKTVDGEYGLREQVQTSLAFSRASGDVVIMQRARAESEIKALPRRKIKFSAIWQYILIAVLAVALAVAGIVVPGKAVEGQQGGEPGVSPDRHHIDIVEMLIKELNDEDAVRNSSAHPEDFLGEKLTSAVRDELSAFRDVLDEALEKHEEIVPSEQVFPVIRRVNALFDGYTDYLQIAQALTKNETTINGPASGFGDLIKAGGDAYRTYVLLKSAKEGKDDQSNDNLTDYHSKMSEIALSAIERKSSDFIKKLIPEEETENTPVSPDGSGNNGETKKELSETEQDERTQKLQDDLAAINDVINLAMAEFDEGTISLCETSVTEALNEFASGLQKIIEDNSYYFTVPSDKQEAGNDPAPAAETGEADEPEHWEAIKNDTSQLFKTFFSALTEVGENKTESLAKQSYYKAFDRHIENNIRSVFGLELISPDIIETHEPEEGDDDDNTGSDNQDTSGSGDLKFPGNDEIFDPFSGEMKKYYEVLNHYNEIKEDQYPADGSDLTDLERQMLEAYFNSLFGSGSSAGN